MRKSLLLPMVIIAAMVCIVSCGEDDLRSPDYNRADELLPKRGEYTDPDLGTQAQAEEIAGVFDSWLSMIYYDKDRTTPLLYFTGGKRNLEVKKNANGSMHLHIEKFHTDFMPLYLTLDMNIFIEDTGGDTIRLSGRDGMVRTTDEGKEIGLALPESDDAEMNGWYLRSNRSISALIDLMLPISMKMRWEGTKKN